MDNEDAKIDRDFQVLLDEWDNSGVTLTALQTAMFKSIFTVGWLCGSEDDNGN